MKVEIKKLVKVDVITLQVDVQVRYWEDSSVNGIEDEHGDLIPCREGVLWKPLIDIDNGKILNWEQGKTANIHYKVCDAGVYTVLDELNNKVVEIDGYVPTTLSPGGTGYGDYIIMKVDSEGNIDNWKFNIDDFTEDDD